MDFVNACEKGRLDKVIELINDGVDIHVYDEYGFRWACSKGRLNVIKYLMEQEDKPNIHENNEEGFRWAFRNRSLEIVMYLVELCDEYEIVMDENGKLVSWKLNKDWMKELIGKEREMGICPICDEDKLLYGMKCDERHEMCEECYIGIRNMGNSMCPYCKEELI